MTEASARVVADNVTPHGERLTTVEATCWRPVLAEQNTHCVLSRNSASSRAIPVAKMLDRYNTDFAEPLVWPVEQKGMQGGADLEGVHLEEAQVFWKDISRSVYKHVCDYVQAHPDPETRLHKSMLNRWLETGLWQTQIISATSWDGYFWQRCHKDAEPHIRAMAEAIRDAMAASTPEHLEEEEWHLPYWGDSGGHVNDWDDALELAFTFGPEKNIDTYKDAVDEIAKRCAVARCARVSYLTQNGVRDLKEDLELYDRLTANRVGSLDPPHASPLEHVATPWAGNVEIVELPNGEKMGPLPRVGKFVGWCQLRHLVLGF